MKKIELLLTDAMMLLYIEINNVTYSGTLHISICSNKSINLVCSVQNRSFLTTVFLPHFKLEKSKAWCHFHDRSVLSITLLLLFVLKDTERTLDIFNITMARQQAEMEVTWHQFHSRIILLDHLNPGYSVAYGSYNWKCVPVAQLAKWSLYWTTLVDFLHFVRLVL